MSEICKNCNGEITLNFCGNCGQKKPQRIDGKYIKDELQYVLVHTNKGFFYSVKKIAKAPGRTAREFLDGNRVNHYKPILLVFLLAGISAFITNTFIHPLEIQAQFNELHGIKNTLENSPIIVAFMKYQSLFMLFSVPFAAVFSWLAFKKYGYNYYENVVANAYLYSATLIFSIVVIHPVQLMLSNHLTLAIMIPPMLNILSMVLISLWFFIQLYPEKNIGSVILRTFLSMAMLIIAVTVAILIVIATYLILNPEKFQAG